MEEPAIAQPQPGLHRTWWRQMDSGRRFTLLVAIVSVLTILGGVIGYSEWKSSQPSMDGLTTKVMASMNQSLSDDEDYRKVGLRVKSITIMRAYGNMFEGWAVAATRKGDDHTVSVHIAYDGDWLSWQAERGAFLFVAQEQLEGG